MAIRIRLEDREPTDPWLCILCNEAIDPAQKPTVFLQWSKVEPWHYERDREPMCTDCASRGEVHLKSALALQAIMAEQLLRGPLDGHEALEQNRKDLLVQAAADIRMDPEVRAWAMDKTGRDPADGALVRG